jgi:hypothetical protein
MKYIYLFLFALMLVGCGASNRIYKSRTINAKGDYTHQVTKIKFPTNVYDFKRKEITSYDDKEENVGVTYELNNPSTFSEFTVYVYPAGPATESRLTQQYFSSLQSITNVAKKGIGFSQKIVPYKKDNYTVNGLFAKSKYDKLETSLTLFECGQWFLKYRISTNSTDSAYINNLRDSLLEVFNPIEIVKKFPIKPETKIYIAPAAYKDTLMLTSIIGNALNRLKWINENVDSLERCSGFPNLYLKSFSVPLEEMIKWFEKNKVKYPKEYWDNKYILTIKKIIDAGYINEFLMDENSMLLIVPDDITLRFEDYYKWKEENLSDFDLRSKYFVLEYPE